MSKNKNKKPASLGKELLKGRNKAGLSISDINLKTKIPVNFITALEKDQLDKLPATVYIKGFIKAYAKETALDYQKLISLLPADQDEPSPVFSQNTSKDKSGKIDLPMPAISSTGNSNSDNNEDNENKISSGLVLFILLILTALSISYFASREESNNTHSPSAREVSNYDSAG
ncbi:MAG: helix-turn-helix domain-containing protein [Myxococcota bacterium]